MLRIYELANTSWSFPSGPAQIQQDGEGNQPP